MPRHSEPSYRLENAVVNFAGIAIPRDNIAWAAWLNVAGCVRVFLKEAQETKFVDLPESITYEAFLNLVNGDAF